MGVVAARYDEDCASISTEEALSPMLDVLEELAAGGAALEFAIGTGRVGLPLAARGVPVSGIDLSEDMVDELRRKPGGDALPVIIGDMATTTVPGTYDLVTQQLTSHHYRVGDRELLASHHRWVWFGEMDLMARMGGMRLRERWADWQRTPPTNDNTGLVSIYEKPN